SFGGSVGIVHVGIVFQKLVLVNHLPELLLGDEVVVHTFLFTGAGGSSGGGDGENQVLPLFHHLCQNRALSHTGGPGNQKNTAFIHFRPPVSYSVSFRSNGLPEFPGSER